MALLTVAQWRMNRMSVEIHELGIVHREVSNGGLLSAQMADAVNVRDGTSKARAPDPSRPPRSRGSKKERKKERQIPKHHNRCTSSVQYFYLRS
jgi:hypothetical protein